MEHTRGMHSSFLKIGIAAVLVLLFCGVFCGAASAVSGDGTDGTPWEFTAAEWNKLGSNSSLINGSIKITGDGTIFPKFNSSTSSSSSPFNLNDNVTIDFSGYRGTFAGEPAASGHKRGALFGCVYVGSKNLTIKNLTMEDVNVTGPSNEGRLEYGGIVGYVSGAGSSTPFLKFENCTLKNCKVYAKSGLVGGLVGRVGWASTSHISKKVDATNCTVANCSVASTGGTRVGGLVGYAQNSASCFIQCDVENCSLSGYQDVGGLVGWAQSALSSPWMDSCKVTNCIISAGDIHVGGLVGYAYYASSYGIEGCTVTGCTVASCSSSYYSAVGGLVGGAHSESNFDTGRNWVNSSAIRGYGTVGEVVGVDSDGPTKNTSDYPSKVMNNSIIWMNTNGNDGYPKVHIAKFDTNPGPEKNDYFNDTTVTSVPSGAVTKLTGYGRLGQYKAFAYVDGGTQYTITNESGGNGDTEVTKSSAATGESVTATAFANSGYHFVNWTCVNLTESVVSVNPYPFIMPGKNVTLTANFAANVTNVMFYNQSELIESKLNTYKAETNATQTAPSRLGYEFAGWNVSREDGTPFNSDTYNKTGTWNYTGAHYTGEDDIGTLKVYANWTVWNKSATVVNGIAEFGGGNHTAIRPSDIIIDVLLKNVSDVENGQTVTFIANSTIVTDIPSDYRNYEKKETITIFEIDAGTASSVNITVNITFKDEEKATNYKDKVFFWHYTNGWDSEPLNITREEPSGANVLYTVKTASFSPFGVGIYEETQAPPTPQQPSSSSSRSYGASVWLQEGQTAPTAAPTTEPTAEPTQAVPTASPVKPVQTSASPLPVAGVLAGLGAAALVFGLRRK